MDRTRLLVVVVLLVVACIGLWWIFFPLAAPPAVVPDGSVDPGISVPESALSGCLDFPR